MTKLDAEGLPDSREEFDAMRLVAQDKYRPLVKRLKPIDFLGLMDVVWEEATKRKVEFEARHPEMELADRVRRGPSPGARIGNQPSRRHRPSSRILDERDMR